jgi:hypothetical protein
VIFDVTRNPSSEKWKTAKQAKNYKEKPTIFKVLKF